MTPAALLTDLRARGVVLEARADRLHCEGPADILTPEVIAELRERKSQVLELLNRQEPPATWRDGELARFTVLAYGPGEEPRWCACCGVELLDPHSARCGWCQRRPYEPGEDLHLDDDWRGGVRA